MRPNEVLDEHLGRRWQGRLEKKLERLSEQALASFYLDALRSVEELTKDPPGRPGLKEVWAYLRPKGGQEQRWQTAALFADRVLLDRPRWAGNWLVVTEEDLAVRIASGKAASTPIPHTRRGFRKVSTLAEPADRSDASRDADDIDDILDPALRVDNLLTGFRSELPKRATDYARFLSHLVPLLDARRVNVIDAWEPTWRDTVKSLTQRTDEWGENSFGHSLRAIGASAEAVSEAVSLYSAGTRIGTDKAPLVPTSPGAEEVARLLVTNWQRLDFGVMVGPSGEPVEAEDEGYDRRPALFDEIAWPALPELKTTRSGAFQEVRESTGFDDLRSQLRATVESVNGARDAAALKKRIAEEQKLLADRAKSARRKSADIAASKRRKRFWTYTGAGVGGALGLVVVPPLGVITGLIVNKGIEYALEKGMDPQTPLDDVQLALIRLTEA